MADSKFLQVLVVQRVYSFIHWINQYRLDTLIHMLITLVRWIVIFPVDAFVSKIQREVSPELRPKSFGIFEQRDPGRFLFRHETIRAICPTPGWFEL